MAFFGILSMAFVVPQIVGGLKMFKERQLGNGDLLAVFMNINRGWCNGF